MLPNRSRASRKAYADRGLPEESPYDVLKRHLRKVDRLQAGFFKVPYDTGHAHLVTAGLQDIHFPSCLAAFLPFMSPEGVLPFAELFQAA